MDWTRGRLECELHLKETVRDVCFLHTENMFAVAQKKYCYIYDSAGVELHCLRKHLEVTNMEYLPYHFLLATVGKAGYLKYQDTSTGNLICEHRTKLGTCDTMTQNPYNAVMALGHNNGTVTMWTPNMTKPVVQMLCHRANVTSVAFDLTGNYMATAGVDCQVHIWDARKFGEKLHSYHTPGNTKPATSLDISQNRLLAVGYGSHVQIWKDGIATKAKKPYMQHEMKGKPVQDLHFCPFEDVLGCGHQKGFDSLIIPGAGMANFDTFEANPYSGSNKKQRQESEVKALLEKLKPEMIMLNPDNIGTMDRADHNVIQKEREEEMIERHGEKEKKKTRKRQRGRSTAIKRFINKQSNVRDEKREKILNEMKKKKEAREEKQKDEADLMPNMLKRFKTD